MVSEFTPPVGGDNRSDDADGPEGPPERELIFPRGRPMRIPADAVALTVLDAETLRRFQGGDGGATADPEGSPDVRTPLGIRLPVFEGPLDLLLHLIRRDKLDIYDIPIGHITEHYLGMLGLMQVFDLDVAGEFLVMAATLMRIKSRMLLPTWPEDEDEEDPRAELVRQLLEYRKFKEAAGTLRRREEERRLQFGRGALPEAGAGEPAELIPLSQFDLIEVMREVLARVGEEFFYEITLEDVTLEEKIALVMGELAERGRALFLDLVSRYPRRLHVVVTFMALLELARLGKITVAQEAGFGPIWIYPGPGEIVVPDESVPAEAVPQPAPEGENPTDTHGTS